nr:MAG TPA: hypothetical protein [Caudoviricetes sp.]
MADPDNDGEENTTPPPTEEEQQTETVDDEVKPKEEPEPEPEGPDVSARLDTLEKELAALKAMLDTLGYNDPAPSDNDETQDNDGTESIEDLFD